MWYSPDACFVQLPLGVLHLTQILMLRRGRLSSSASAGNAWLLGSRFRSRRLAEVEVACIGLGELATEFLEPIRGGEDLSADPPVLETNALSSAR